MSYRTPSTPHEIEYSEALAARDAVRTRAPGWPISRIAAGMIVVAAVLTLSAGCGGGSSKTAEPTVAPAKSTTVSIQVDGSAADHNEMFHHFSPDAATVHPGDTVSFSLHDSGEPHTVSFGSFVDPVFQFIDQNCPNGYGKAPCDDSGPLELRSQLTILVQQNFPELLGEADAKPGPANPCFLETGALPVDARCPAVAQPTFTGRQSVYSSGWLGADKSFTVQLADDIKPGTYRFVCLVHRLEMVETITVVDKSETAQSAADVKRNGQQQLAQIGERGRGAAEQLEATNDGTTIHAGAWPGGGVHINEFGPKTLTVPVGGTVTWKSQGGHTIAFNATEDAKGARSVAADGSIHINAKALTPSGMPARGTSDPSVTLDGGTWDGTTFFNTGLLNDPFTFTLTFSKAGTYQYKCLIHDNMEGTIKVGSQAGG